jgi:D-galactarolactone cycloisomerase
MAAALSDHRIAEIRTRSFQSRYPRTIGKNARLGSHGEGPRQQIREIVTDQGTVGWGISWVKIEELPNLVGRPVAELIDPAVGVVAPEAMGLDFPLHDLAGVILGQPVWKMLGGRGPREISCYDGAIYMDDVDPEDAPRGLPVVLANCEHDYGMGYRAFKLKIGRGNRWMEPEAGLRRDIEVTRAVRERYPDSPILVDANDGYTCDGFLRYLEAVADCHLFWIEEPFRENRDDLRRLREFVDTRCPETLLADGESAPDIPFLLELARERLLDVLLMDIAGLGFTRWRELMPTLIEIGVKASPHTWGQPVKTNYTGQLAAGLGNVVTVEGIPAETIGVDRSAYRLAEGMLRVPESAPGFGLWLAAEG